MGTLTHAVRIRTVPRTLYWQISQLSDVVWVIDRVTERIGLSLSGGDQQMKPNVIFFMVDQMGAKWLEAP